MWLTEPRNLKRLRSIWGHVQGVLFAIFLYLILEQLFLTYARQKLFYKRLNLHYFLLFETYLKICHFFHFFLYSFCLHDFSVQFLLNFYYSQTQNLVTDLRWSFLRKKRFLFWQKTPSQILDWVLYTPLNSVDLWLNSLLTLSWRRSLSYRDQSIDLLCKSMDWFLCDRDLHRERVKLI